MQRLGFNTLFLPDCYPSQPTPQVNPFNPLTSITFDPPSFHLPAKKTNIGKQNRQVQVKNQNCSESSEMPRKEVLGILKKTAYYFAYSCIIMHTFNFLVFFLIKSFDQCNTYHFQKHVGKAHPAHYENIGRDIQ